MHHQYVQKYVIVHFVNVEKAPTDFSASEWPLHITLLANFQVKPIGNFKNRLGEYSKHHNDLLSIATEQNAILDEPRFAGAGYRPHSTIQIKSRLQDRQEVRIDSFSLVDMFPDHNHLQRKILQTYKLSN